VEPTVDVHLAKPESGRESALEPFPGQFDWGGRLKLSEEFLSTVGNRAQSVKAIRSLTARATTQAGTKVGLSDPTALRGRAVAQRIKVTLGITG